MELKLGLQLYSIRQLVEQDMGKALEKVAEIGYSYVEFAGFYGNSAKEVKAMLDANGLECVSVHKAYTDFMGASAQKEIDFLNEIGAKYSAIPWISDNDLPGGENYPNFIADAKEVGAALKNAGIQLLYHNHEHEFVKVNGEYKFDVLVRDSQGLILYEPDIAWIKYSEIDPVEFIKQRKSKCPVVHLKDFTGSIKEGRSTLKFKPLGYGMQGNIREIIDTSLECGSKYFIAELDNTDEMPPEVAAELSFNYVKNLYT